ncbi:MAG: DOPA 4,5-dioxygenase family protein [Candidatus Brevundimonas colombiensis]|uniref:DOPA 4,5-dioxygenase family protein n=1 Tax=Candidatus Brevundimonas colombiensis TaxID=3121376 RepID=A0AAJ5WZZ9_9CAUL|nr:DOPA 4,5-dioxygenase family protein [Brevundimonas sp.]WEK40479.1 MAG: DOPA 4,5-dioxygenase family protein [Brevundimonas sp.]
MNKTFSASRPDPQADQDWADLLSPGRRVLLAGSGLALVAGLAGGAAKAQTPGQTPAREPAQNLSRTGPGAAPAGRSAAVPPAPTGRSPWGYETYKEPATRPAGIRPGEETLPTLPRAYTDIKSYHAHIYFDEDTYEKAALLRTWAIERFPVELGNWNLEPRGPHVTPSFYFGFTNDLLPVLVPWLQLNSLGLTILLHPNTNDPRADHLHYALWVNRAQPVNGYNLPSSVTDDRIEQIFPNVTPTIAPETA